MQATRYALFYLRAVPIGPGLPSALQDSNETAAAARRLTGREHIRAASKLLLIVCVCVCVQGGALVAAKNQTKPWARNSVKPRKALNYEKADPLFLNFLSTFVAGDIFLFL